MMITTQQTIVLNNRQRSCPCSRLMRTHVLDVPVRSLHIPLRVEIGYIGEIANKVTSTYRKYLL